MRQLSASNTFFYKRVFPVIWFAGVFAFLAFGVNQAVARRGAGDSWFFFAAPLVVLVGGFVVMKMFIFDLVDEVWDDGRELVVRNRGREVRISLAEIINVNYERLSNPPRVTLLLHDPTELGSEITFMAPRRPFTMNPARDLALELIGRIEAARNGWDDGEVLPADDLAAR
jgi:hypothetical protein